MKLTPLCTTTSIMNILAFSVILLHVLLSSATFNFITFVFFRLLITSSSYLFLGLLAGLLPTCFLFYGCFVSL